MNYKNCKHTVLNRGVIVTVCFFNNHNLRQIGPHIKHPRPQYRHDRKILRIRKFGATLRLFSQKNMGIKGLSQLLADHAPGCVKENEIKNYFGLCINSLKHAYLRVVKYLIRKYFCPKSITVSANFAGLIYFFKSELFYNFYCKTTTISCQKVPVCLDC